MLDRSLKTFPLPLTAECAENAEEKSVRCASIPWFALAHDPRSDLIQCNPDSGRMLVRAANRPAKRGIRGLFSIDAVPPHTTRAYRHPTPTLLP
ncbi:MAG: hypothetical protein WBG50_10045 [Desulfomonilaceae bacterium]